MKDASPTASCSLNASSCFDVFGVACSKTGFKNKIFLCKDDQGSYFSIQLGKYIVLRKIKENLNFFEIGSVRTKSF